MKKTLLAMAALAATSSVFAQSSVTLYGVIDASIENIKTATNLTRVSSDNLSTSRLGFKGTEDIGGGLKANFALETAVKADSGANGNSARFFDRAAWVGLAGGLGEVRVGRIDSSIGDIAGNVLSAQAYDDLKIAGTRAGDTYRRVDNSVTYYLPTLVDGLSTQLQYSTAVGVSGTVGSENAAGQGRALGLSIKYAAGPIAAGVGYLSAKDETLSVSDNPKKGNATLVYAGYDFGVAKVTAYFDAESKKFENQDRLTVAGVKVAVPVSPAFTVTAGFSKASNLEDLVGDGKNDDATITTIKAVYTLTKRTAVYGMFTNVDNEDNAKLGVVAPALGKSSRALAFGIRHAF